MIELRPEVQAFAEQMERQLRLNEHKGGWKGSAPVDLYSGMMDHVVLMHDNGVRHRPMAADERAQLVDDCADVANFAMMVADVCGALPAGSATTEGKAT